MDVHILFLKALGSRRRPLVADLFLRRPSRPQTRRQPKKLDCVSFALCWSVISPIESSRNNSSRANSSSVKMKLELINLVSHPYGPHVSSRWRGN